MTGVRTVLKELLTFIVKSLIEKPEEFEISEAEREHSVVYKIKVADSDMGKIIGKQGRIAKAIRGVMKAAGSHENKKVTVEIG